MTAMRFYVLSRSALPILLVVGLTVPSFAAADDSKPAEQQQGADTTPKQRLDQLFADLKRERDPERANIIADQIRMEWADSGSATINLLMQWADKAIAEKRNAAAYDFLDQAIALKPDYAEAWNRRATLNYALGDYRKSMEDIDQVLRIEPRHFGALAGMAAILGDSGNDQVTLKAWERFLEIFPANRAAQQQVDTLSEKLAGSRT
ncbi:tetratricopeptide repeat protein [Rhizobium sp. BK376]|uniref:tetratricopeptide repeat protein n=1 Tax=Rhizobium sp. BK376 TaxID=2512149 RepID=UPI001053B5F3|nr:tetratricopeptide repeat protein [Rhizobium sp. BK376]TCR91614.1 tetratricopeptide repeat protein [Rhizobium sp. BK376]